MAGKQNGTVGALINAVEAAHAAGVDPRTIRKWTETDHPDLGVVAGGTLFIRREVLERIIRGPVESGDAPRITVILKSGYPVRLPTDVADQYLKSGATIPPEDELSQRNYQVYLAEIGEAAEVAP